MGRQAGTPTRRPLTPDRPLTLDDLDGEISLPWYYSWWRVAAISMAVTLAVVGAVGLAVGGNPGAKSVDVGFLQDMRSHHDQAVQMSLSFLTKTDVDPTLHTIAAEILLAQQQETGIMVEILRRYGAEEENSTGTSMSWMGESVPTDRMPGMASDAELARLDAATGSEADQLFIELMIAHHQGGIHMAQYAAAHADTGRVGDAARTMAVVQSEEVDELQTISARLGSPG